MNIFVLFYNIYIYITLKFRYYYFLFYILEFKQKKNNWVNKPYKYLVLKYFNNEQILTLKKKYNKIKFFSVYLVTTTLLIWWYALHRFLHAQIFSLDSIHFAKIPIIHDEFIYYFQFWFFNCDVNAIYMIKFFFRLFPIIWN